jgi:small GTP-binding protein
MPLQKKIESIDLLFYCPPTIEYSILTLVKMNVSEYNILLLGNGGVGKTSFVRSLKGDRFQPKYVENTGIEISSFDLDSAVVNIYDTPGQYQYNMEENLKNVFNENNPSLNIIMCDNNNISYKKAMGLWTDIAKDLGGPITYAYNKTDIKYRECPNGAHISCKRNDITRLLNEIIGNLVQ